MITKEKNKGNIPIDNKLLNKYRTARAIFDDVKNVINYSFKEIRIHDIIDIEKLDLCNLKISDAKLLANNIFNKYHINNNFLNNGNKIIVSKSGIDESMEKIYNNRIQRDFMVEHLIIFSKLGIIIESAKLVNQVYEKKYRKYTLFWNYYLNNVYINNKLYIIEFEVRSMHDGENHYRLQRLELSQIKNKRCTAGALDNSKHRTA